MIQDTLALPGWKDVLTDIDRRGLTPLFHTNMTPYGEIQLRTDRRLDLTASRRREWPTPSPSPGRRAAGTPGRIRKAAQAKGNPADLINVALEELVRAQCELPGYTTLDELTKKIRPMAVTIETAVYP
jgi:hypothetical protein